MNIEILAASVIFNGSNTGVSQSIGIRDTSLPEVKVFTPTVLTMGNKVINPAVKYPTMNDGLVFNNAYKFKLSGQGINGRTFTIKAQPYVTSLGSEVILGEQFITNNQAEYIIDLSLAKTGWYMDGVSDGTAIVFKIYHGQVLFHTWSWQVRGTVADRPIGFAYAVLPSVIGVSPDRTYKVTFAAGAGGGAGGGMTGAAGGNGSSLLIHVWDPIANVLRLIATVGGGKGGAPYGSGGAGGAGGSVTGLHVGQIITVQQLNNSRLEMKILSTSAGTNGGNGTSQWAGAAGVGHSGTLGGAGGYADRIFLGGGAGGGAGGGGGFITVEFKHFINNRDAGFTYAPIPVTIIGLDNVSAAGGAGSSNIHNGSFGQPAQVLLYNNT